jgi:hypothetical protein
MKFIDKEGNSMRDFDECDHCNNPYFGVQENELILFNIYKRHYY